jgi:hypothetical protein
MPAAEELRPALAAGIHILANNCDLNHFADAGVTICGTLGPHHNSTQQDEKRFHGGSILQDHKSGDLAARLLIVWL